MNSAIKIIAPTGILDSAKSESFRQEIIDFVDEGINMFLIDLKDISFMDSSGLGALVLSLKTVRTAGGKMFICSINEQIKMLFELTSMDLVFEIFADRDEFKKAILSEA